MENKPAENQPIEKKRELTKSQKIMVFEGIILITVAVVCLSAFIQVNPPLIYTILVSLIVSVALLVVFGLCHYQKSPGGKTLKIRIAEMLKQARKAREDRATPERENNQRITSLYVIFIGILCTGILLAFVSIVTNAQLRHYGEESASLTSLMYFGISLIIIGITAILIVFTWQKSTESTEERIKLESWKKLAICGSVVTVGVATLYVLCFVLSMLLLFGLVSLGIMLGLWYHKLEENVKKERAKAKQEGKNSENGKPGDSQAPCSDSV